jgi:hypothetical protein
MLDYLETPHVPLPRHWTRHVRSAVLHVISLARFVMAEVRGWAINSPIARLRLAARLEQAHQEIALLREELRIKDSRMAQIPAHRRPFYMPTERMAILELRAARGWNQIQTAEAMRVTWTSTPQPEPRSRPPLPHPQPDDLEASPTQDTFSTEQKRPRFPYTT